MAAAAGADVLVIDHVDHLDSAESSLYHTSVAVNQALLLAAQEHGFRVLAATQFNNDVVRTNRILRYSAPQPNYIYMGGHKRQIASGMLGLYRPLKINGADKNTLAAFRDGNMETQDVLEPNTMAVSVLKHRLYGQREGQRIYLRIEHGRVLDANQDYYRSTRHV